MSDLWTLTDGAGILKRVGPKLPGTMAPLRQFESIGGLGSSEIVASEAIEGQLPQVPVMAYAREVLGVLYDDWRARFQGDKALYFQQTLALISCQTFCHHAN
jgi:hypothetical protein